MMLSRLRKFLFIVIILTNANAVSAQQNFLFHAAVDSVLVNGVYTITISPDIVSRCQPQLEDLRLLDDKGSQTSYVINRDTSTNNLQPLPRPTLTQKDSSDKNTYLFINYSETYQINALEILVSAPKFYKRPITIYNGAKHNAATSFIGFINSTKPAIFHLDEKAASLAVVIENEDNLPLQIQQVKAWQDNIQLTAYLEAGKKYALYFGDLLAEAPKYDLRFFYDSIKNKATPIRYGAIEKKQQVLTAKTTDKKNDVLLWLVIGAVLIVLIAFTYSFLKEVNKKNTDAHL